MLEIVTFYLTSYPRSSLPSSALILESPVQLPSAFLFNITMASRVASKSSKWLSEPAVYPLLACISFGAVLCASMGTRYLTSSPDVKWNREKRMKPDVEAIAEPKSWVSHRQPIKNLANNRVNTHGK